MKIATLVTAAILLASAGLSQASDPAGAWSTCKHYTGKTIVVAGNTCPAGWMKQY